MGLSFGCASPGTTRAQTSLDRGMLGAGGGWQPSNPPFLLGCRDVVVPLAPSHPCPVPVWGCSCTHTASPPAQPVAPLLFRFPGAGARVGGGDPTAPVKLGTGNPGAHVTSGERKEKQKLMAGLSGWRGGSRGGSLQDGGSRGAH